MPLSEDNRFIVKGELMEVAEEEYKEGKKLARFLVKTERLDLEGDPEPVEVEFTAFGKSRDIVLNSAPGVIITVKGHLEGRFWEERSRWFLEARVGKITTEGNPNGAANAQARQAQVAADEEEMF